MKIDIKVEELKYKNMVLEDWIAENNKKIKELESKKFKKFVLIVEEVPTEDYNCGGCCFGACDEIDCCLGKAIYKIVEAEEHDI